MKNLNSYTDRPKTSALQSKTVNISVIILFNIQELCFLPTKFKGRYVYCIIPGIKKNIFPTDINKTLFPKERQYAFCEIATDFFNINFLIILMFDRFQGTVGLLTRNWKVYISQNKEPITNSLMILDQNIHNTAEFRSLTVYLANNPSPPPPKKYKKRHFLSSSLIPPFYSYLHFKSFF